MNHRMLAAGLALLGAFDLFASAGRVTVLDFGIAPGATNRFGCASAPQAFVRALGGAYDVRIVTHDRAKAEGALDNARTDLLVLPSGSLFPHGLAKDVVKFLSKGGLLLTCGGYAFDEPMEFYEGEWVLPFDKPQPSPVCDRPLALPRAAGWQAHAAEGTKTEISDETTPDGKPAVKVFAPMMRRYNLAIAPFPQGDDPATREAVAFRAKGGPGLKVMRLEIAERDGTRWWTNVPVTGEWKDYALSWADFTFHTDSPTVRKRGGAGDRIDFAKAARLSVGVCHIGNAFDRPHTAWIADLRTGPDPLAAKRTRPEPRARINHRHYGPGWMDRPRPDQIGIFSPAYAFRDVASIANNPFNADLYPTVSLKGRFSGWDASVMLTPQINAHAKCRAVLRPVLACRDAAGAPKGCAASLAFHYDAIFKGSAWAIFGVDSADLFATADNDALLRAMADALFRRVFVARTRPAFDCYRPGETMEFSTEVMDFGKAALAGEVRFAVFDETGTKVHATKVPCTARPGEAVKASFSWKVPAADVDLYRIVAEFAADGRTVDREENAIAVWNEKTVAKGPKLGVDGTYFTIDGKRSFWIGAQMFLARQQAYTSASALRFYRDFKGMAEAGMRVSRNFFGWGVMADGKSNPDRERLLRLMDACIVLSQKFGIVNYFNPICGNEIPRTLDAVSCDARDIEMFARRYAKVPGFMMDVRNEARLACVNRGTGREPMSDRALADAFVTWSRAVADAARKGNPAISVATGWSQGWGWGTGYKDPPTAAEPFTFTDCHYYGENPKHLSEIKKIDHRIFGKPAVMGECGVAFHPERIRFSDSFATEEEAARRYRCQAVQTFGSGYAFMCNYGWTDLIEGNTTFAFCHWDGTPRDVLKVYSGLARAFASFEIEERRPEAVLVIGDSRFVRGNLNPVVDVYRRAVDALSWWGVNYSVIPEGERCRLPAGVKLVLDTDELEKAGLGGLYDGDLKVDPRKVVGDRLAAAGVTVARRADEPATLGVFRIPTRGGGEAWAFWNADRKASVTVERGGQKLEIGADRAGLIRLAADGSLVGKEEL